MLQQNGIKCTTDLEQVRIASLRTSTADDIVNYYSPAQSVLPLQFALTDYTASHYLFNCMCDLIQSVVVVVPVPGMTASIIAKYFMQEVLGI